MNNAMHFWINQKVNAFEQDCRSQENQLLRKETMRDVKFATNVHASAEVRFMPQVKHAESRLRSTAEKRMSEILVKHLEVLSELKTVEEFQAQRGRYLQHDWCHLRGDFSRVYVEADRSSMKLLHALKQKVAPLTPDDTPGF